MKTRISAQARETRAAGALRLAALRRRPARRGARHRGLRARRREFVEALLARRARTRAPSSEQVITPHLDRAVRAALAGRARDPLHRRLRARRAPEDAVQGGAERGDRARQELRRHRRLPLRQRRAGKDRQRAAARRSRQVAVSESPERVRAHPPLLRAAAEASALVGVGDDCALLRPDAGLELAVTTDMLVEGRHFRAGAEPRALGHKALAVNLSDLAAMGAAPRWATARASRCRRRTRRWLAAFAAGFFALAERFGVGPRRRRHDARAAAHASPSPRWARCRRAWRSTAPARARATTSGYRASSAARRSASRIPRSPTAAQAPARARAARRARRAAARPGATPRSTFPTASRGDLGHILERSRVGAVVEYRRIPQSTAFKRSRSRARARLRAFRRRRLRAALHRARRRSARDLEALARELGLPLTRVGAIQSGERASRRCSTPTASR